MELKRYGQFINEAKKDDAKEEIVKMLNSKPTVTMSGEEWPTEKDMYTQAGIIKHLKDKYNNNQILNALHDLKNDKKADVKHILVKNYNYDKNYPYYYSGLTDAEAKSAKSKYEEKNEIDNKTTIDKREESKEANKKVIAAKRPARKKAGAKKATPTIKKVGARKATKK